ncbi:MAG: hypothetical protein ACRDHF_03510 [Tepidiformaceae bacterium]
MVIARKRRGAGVAIAAVARELGVRPRALRIWLESPARPRLRRVAIATAPVAAIDRAVLITPQGFRVEGLGAADLVALLRALVGSAAPVKSSSTPSAVPWTCARGSMA